MIFTVEGVQNLEFTEGPSRVAGFVGLGGGFGGFCTVDYDKCVSAAFNCAGCFFADDSTDFHGGGDIFIFGETFEGHELVGTPLTLVAIWQVTARKRGRIQRFGRRLKFTSVR